MALNRERTHNAPTRRRESPANAAATRLGRGVVTVVPVTSATDRVYPFQVLLRAADTGLRNDSKAQAEQVRAVEPGPRLAIMRL